MPHPDTAAIAIASGLIGTGIAGALLGEDACRARRRLSAMPSPFQASTQHEDTPP
jgi:hypothetical protein